MAVDLTSTILNIYTRGSIRNRYAYREDENSLSEGVMMDVPLNAGEIEIPMVAVWPLNEYLYHHDAIPDILTIKLAHQNYIPYYKSIDIYMEDVLTISWGNYGLIKLKVEQNDNTIIYYGANGAVFNANGFPLMMCTWVMERTVVSGVEKLQLVKPIMRISPLVYLSQANPLERYLSKKLPTAALSMPIDTGRFFPAECFLPPRNLPLDVEVIIGKIPFTTRVANKPSRSISDRELLSLALEHIDDLRHD